MVDDIASFNLPKPMPFDSDSVGSDNVSDGRLSDEAHDPGILVDETRGGRCGRVLTVVSMESSDLTTMSSTWTTSLTSLAMADVSSVGLLRG